MVKADPTKIFKSHGFLEVVFTPQPLAPIMEITAIKVVKGPHSNFKE